METEPARQKRLFRDIDADDDDPEVTEMESLCVNCEEQGLTRLFLTKIPFFKEVILSSFSCEHCGLKNTELQPAGCIKDKGTKYTLQVQDVKDLNRQVIQTQSASVIIPEIEFEVSPGKGVLTTVEGIIERAVDGLEQGQVLRRIQYPEDAEKIDAFIEKLKELKSLKSNFSLVLDDPSGNSFIENPNAPNKDCQLSVEPYTRTKIQNEAIGIFLEEDEEKSNGQDIGTFTAKNEVVTFQTTCPNCNTPCQTNMKVVDIPHFKEVVIMATVCDACGYRDNEVKGGSGIEPKGSRIELHITDPSDLSRDVLKSDMSKVELPELDIVTAFGTLGGKFTTVEGLLSDIKNQLGGSNPFLQGDSADPNQYKNLKKLCNSLQEIIEGKRLNVHFILDDPSGNSYVQNIYAPDRDPEMKVTSYERNHEQNEELGLNDMKTAHYEES